METINNAASAAAKAVWGEQQTHKEPVSGVKGDVAKGEPYDAGNMEPTQQERVEQSFEGRFENAPATQPAQENITPHHTETSPVDGLPSGHSERRNVETSINEPPSESHEPNEAPMNQDSRPSEGFDSRPQQPSLTTDTSREKIPETKPVGSNSSQKSEDSSKGTGQEYVRSTGLAADGGDFDATKPGAGREAERLMEQKALHHNEDDPHADGGKDKQSLGDRIKAKLHKHQR